ncbi:MAG: aspartate kinase [Defluviitaleaceae bacterium]|nr:aspartate kinase [Defluviitaleaceae bacterium]
MLVCKFGGSSLSSEDQFKKVKKIVESNGDRRIIVVSALGKREATDNKLTDLLYVIHTHAKHGISYESLWQEVATRFMTVKTELRLTFDIEAALSRIKADLDQHLLSVDDLVSRGEYLTAHLMSDYLGFNCVDAKDVIIFNASGDVDFKTTQAKLKAKVGTAQVVIPGFYGAYPNGKIKLFGRGGSDISGAIVAASLKATKYENFTDVSGVLVADPRIITDPPAISGLTYEELSELTYMGANVLHEESAHPVRDAGIPIHIKNTNDPDAPGTLICNGTESAATESKVVGISGKKDFLSFTLYKDHMSTELGFLEKALEIFSRYHVNVEHVPTGIDHVGVVVEKASVAHCLEDLVDVLKRELIADEIEIKDGIALMTIVGRQIIDDATFLSRVFAALGTARINISFIAQSPKLLNMIIGVKNEDYITATQALYKELIRCVY